MSIEGDRDESCRFGSGQLCHWCWGPQRREKVVGRGRMKIPLGTHKTEEEETPP